MRFHLQGGEWVEARTPAQCDFLVEALELPLGARVLDLCCGQGRISVELARRGFAVTGLDLSEYLLNLAKERAEAAGVAVEWVHRDMRDLPWENEFDAVVSVFTSFGYLETDEEDEKALGAVQRCLKPGGRLLLDVHNREWTAIRFQPRYWYEHEGHLILDEETWDERQGRITMARTIIAPDGSRRETGFTLRIYAPSEMMKMLERAGLEWERTFGGWEASQYTALSRGMMVVARKASVPG
jgi:ubiquinone/menaquinone biosynthesis C-methylase UbiE